MSELAQKKVEQAPVTEVKKADNVVQRKLVSIVFVAIAFVILYFAVSSGNETFMWAALGIMALSQVVMYMRN